MTIYAGEYVKIAVKIEGQKVPNKFEVLTDDDVESGQISVWSENGNAVVVDQALVFDSETGLWFFYWDTAGRSPGAYEYRCTFYGQGERRTWEEGFVTLHRSNRPVIVVTD